MAHKRTKKAKDVTVAARYNEDKLKKVRKKAKRENKNVSDVIREGLDAYQLTYEVDDD